MADLPDNFADYPQSVTEIRSERTSCGRDWTPRDVLIDVLRDLDNGKIKPDALVVVWHGRDANDELTCPYVQSSPSAPFALGMLTRTIYRINQGMDPD